MKYRVEPVSKKTVVPPHPVEGPMPDEGGADWIADQYTLRLILDGVIRRVEEKAEEPPPKGAKPTKAVPAEVPASPPARTETAPAEAKAKPAPGTVASVPFMITAADRNRLKALGKSDDEIRNMKPEEAQAALNAEPAPSAPAAPQEA